MHVLVATDGTLDIDEAATFAMALAGDDGKITVATIVRIPRRLVQELRAQYGEHAGVTVDSDAESVRSRGGTADSIVMEGEDVASDIINLTDEIGADVIVIGSHGHGAFQGLLGSTGAKLVRRSTVPVLVVR